MSVEPPAKKKRIAAWEKREQFKADWDELQRNPPATLEKIFQDLCSAGAVNDKAALAEASDSLKEHLIGKLNVRVYGRRDLEDEVRSMMKRLARGFIEPAKHDIRKRVRLVVDIMEVWNFIGQTGVALTKLDRPKKFGDGTRAFYILLAYIEEVMDTFLTYNTSIEGVCDLWQQPYGDFISFETIRSELDAARERSGLTIEEELELEDDTEDLKVQLSRKFVSEMEEAFGVAVQKACEEQKRSKRFVEMAGEREDALAKTCWLFAEKGYGEEKRDNMGFSLFVDGRDALRELAGDGGSD
ncbi:hypothetical protein OE88DRAFT_1733851 [Heliocybe sulcata]|uniref:Uncharacterized protein n=1 Tax=Heliocybe sulcata TaxID=5364 RepID=A0A5C3N6M2_9AGAM|nr:hypothetical protein OE88DRAFT_1733851 [Heliocybe sulcata]